MALSYVTARLRQTYDKVMARNNAESALLTAHFLTNATLADHPEANNLAQFVTNILPLIAADFDPITILDPCCGSDIMLIAAARQFPAWSSFASRTSTPPASRWRSVTSSSTA